jgi:cytochrome b561
MPQPTLTPPKADTAVDYGAVAIALHWLLALAIAALFIMGSFMADLPLSPLRLKLYNWHKWAGVTFLALSLVRLLWRATHRPPELPNRIRDAMPAWQQRAHHGVHHLLYALFFAVPLLGWAYSNAAGFPIVWLGWLALPDLLAPNPTLAPWLKSLHQTSALALVGLAGVHVAAALKHQWLDRDGLLSRMSPLRRTPTRQS